VAFVLAGLGRVHLAQARPVDAVLLLERALEIRARANTPSYEQAEVRILLAKALMQTNESDRAVALAREALEQATAGSELRAVIEAWLRAAGSDERGE